MLPALWPMFPSHYQPRLPGELGFYDLRLEDTRAEQAALASAYGIAAFCYWHYWFGGRRVLDRVVDDVIRSGVPDFPFCLGWANESWSSRKWARDFRGAERGILLDQTYPGDDDYRRHFDTVEAAFHDPRYVRVGGKPLFLVYRPLSLPEPRHFVELWQRLAQESGLPGLFLVGETGRAGDFQPSAHHFDAAVPWTFQPMAQRLAEERRHRSDWLATAALQRIPFLPDIFSYRRWVPYFPWVRSDGELSFPCIITGWDDTPRRGRGALIFHGDAPDVFEAEVRRAVGLVADLPRDQRIVFVKSWNEWAEGNYLEPDRRFERAFLEACLSATTS